MNLRYLLGATVSIPLLPIIYFQGKRISASVPKLPEATGTVGKTTSNEVHSIRLITIGESTIAGVGAKTHEEAFTGALARNLAKATGKAVQWRVYAKSGYTVKMMREKLLPMIEETALDLIVVGTGGNDAFTLNRPWKWRREQAALITDLQAKFPKTPICFTNMPPIKEFPAFTPLIRFVVGNLVQLLGDELGNLVQDYEQVYFNAEQVSFDTWTKRYNISGDIAQFFSDGVHPATITYQIWGKDFANYIARQQILNKHSATLTS